MSQKKSKEKTCKTTSGTSPKLEDTTAITDLHWVVSKRYQTSVRDHAKVTKFVGLCPAKFGEWLPSPQATAWHATQPPKAFGGAESVMFLFGYGKASSDPRGRGSYFRTRATARQAL